MKRQSWTYLFAIVALCGCLFLFGFVVFANAAMRSSVAALSKSDAIVVLTGARLRIEEGMRLLDQGLGRRMLISGVNQVTSRQDIKALLKASDRFDCCVDLGYEARNTSGNANEIANWARQRDFRKLIVVTSNYHMPRAMAELGRVHRDATLIPHVVVPETFRNGPWWLNYNVTKLLANEYLKYLPAVIQLGFNRLLTQLPAGPTNGDGKAPAV
ncbi:MAG: YdcF family protein [Pseudomonadota bacterium]